MYINLKIPDEWNEERNKINVTWKAVVQAGLAALQNKNIESEKLPPAIKSHLEQAFKSFGNAWKLLKPFTEK